MRILIGVGGGRQGGTMAAKTAAMAAKAASKKAKKKAARKRKWRHHAAYQRGESVALALGGIGVVAS